MQFLPENADHIILIYEHGRKVFSDFFIYYEIEQYDQILSSQGSDQILTRIEN